MTVAGPGVNSNYDCDRVRFYGYVMGHYYGRGKVRQKKNMLGEVYYET